MEIVATTFVGRIALKLFAFLDENYRLRRNLEHDIQRIRMELDMIDAAIHDHDYRRSKSQVQTAWIQLARELGHSIDDCIDRFSHRLAKNAAGSPLRKTVSRLKTAPIRTEFATEIRKIRKISEEVSKLRECYGGGEPSTSEASAPGTLSDEVHALAADLVGMDAPRDELLELIRDTEGNLLLLRYLSLGGPISVLPKEIAKLKLLETLDITRTKIEILPIQVIELPCLIHLFGKFKLEDVSQRISKLKNSLSEKSNLQTLSGFVADKGFAQLMDHMNNLTKVKICCESTMDASSITHLSKSIKGFIERGTHASDLRSLSLNFNECSEDLLSFSLEKSCHLSKLKLQGNIFSLPPFVTTLAGLTELCLSSLGKFTGDVLAALSTVHSLQYLKLIASHMDKFVIRKGQLNILLCLCVVVQSMEGLEIEGEALLCFESLQLLCKGLNGLGGIRMELLGRLKEVALDDGVSDKAKQEWEEAAKKHPRRPKVLFVKIMSESEADHQMQTGGMEPAENPAALAPGHGAQVHLLNQGAEQTVVQMQATPNPILIRGQ